MMRIRALAALLLASLVGISSCTPGADGPSAPSTGEPPHTLGSENLLGTSLGGKLLACEPLPYAVTTRTIGSAGGTISVGPHWLTIPAGSLAEPVTITAEAPVGTVNSVRFQPEGLRFAPGKPARLTLSYANCRLLGQVLPKRIAYTDDLLSILYYILSVDDPISKRVTGALHHFSRYAVAW